MEKFRASLTKLEKNDIAIIWIDTKYMHHQDELKKHLIFYKELLNLDDVALMMLSGNEEPHYYGKKELVELLKKYNWKRFRWQEYEIDKNQNQ